MFQNAKKERLKSDFLWTKLANNLSFNISSHKNVLKRTSTDPTDLRFYVCSSPGQCWFKTDSCCRNAKCKNIFNNTECIFNIWPYKTHILTQISLQKTYIIIYFILKFCCFFCFFLWMLRFLILRTRIFVVKVDYVVMCI